MVNIINAGTLVVVSAITLAQPANLGSGDAGHASVRIYHVGC